MTTVAYPLRIPEEILTLAKLRSKEEYVDQSTVIRQLLYLRAEEYILGLVESGRISIGKAAELLKISIQDISRLAQKHGVCLGATVEQQKKSAQAMEKIIL